MAAAGHRVLDPTEIARMFDKSPMRHHVYLLRDPNDGQPRYIGLTSKLRQRRQQHRSGNACPDNQELTDWEKSLKASGQQPELEVIETIITYKAKYSNVAGRKAEELWIHYFRTNGAELFNKT